MDVVFSNFSLINSEILNKCYKILTNGKYHSVLPLSHSDQPIERALKLDKSNRLKFDNSKSSEKWDKILSHLILIQDSFVGLILIKQ